MDKFELVISSRDMILLKSSAKTLSMGVGLLAGFGTYLACKAIHQSTFRKVQLVLVEGAIDV